MALKNTPDTSAADTAVDGKFEVVGDDDETSTTTETKTGSSALDEARRQAAAHAEAQAAAEAAPASTQRAVAAAPKKAVAVQGLASLNPFPAVMNAFPVEFNTFPQIKATQGQFMLQDGNKSMGDEITIELISYQDQFMLAPGDVDDPKSKEFLRYSEDGVTATNGDDMQKILELAKAQGFDKAKIQKRVVLVGNVVNGGKQKDATGKIHQMDLAPTSGAHFKRHQANIAFLTSKGQLKEGTNVLLLKLTAIPKNANNMNWTEVTFDQGAEA
jgi:hypothetical protein